MQTITKQPEGGAIAELEEQAPSPGPTCPHLLVVDDENGPRQALRMLLNEEYYVHLAPNVDTALDILRTEPIELVITDIRMPNKTGVDLLREAKATHPDVQVIMFTGYGHLETAVKAVEFGAFAYMEKPFDNDEMLRMVRAAQEQFIKERERRALERIALEASRFETLGRLVSGMMHDLGSPLTVLSSQLELLLVNPNRGDLEKRLESMRTQVEYCNDMARTTMDYLRCDSGPSMPLRMNAVVTSCIEVASPLLKELRVLPRYDLAKVLPPTKGDLVLVRQAILNVITNACQAMETQSENRTLDIKTWADDDHVHISIQDSGPGVPEDLRNSIFETFFTTKGNAGTGLGLGVVKSVLKRCGGTVELNHPSENGACFTLSFPIRD